jgi:uncharacterized protein
VDPRLTILTLGVADLPRSRAFYVDGLGWEPVLDLDEVVFIPIGHGVLLGLFDAADLAADVGSPEPAGPSSTHPGASAPVTMAHNVDDEADVDSAVERVEAAGGTVVKAPQRAAFGGYHAYVADPDGFRWEIAHNPGLTFDDDGHAHFSPVPPPDDR